MVVPLPGDPEALLAASRGLEAAATGLTSVHDAVLGRGRSLTGVWRGQAATTALARLDGDARQLQHAVDVVQGAAAPLATYAEELRIAQEDHARGEQMLLAAQQAAASVGSGAAPAADAARDAAAQARTEATLLMDQAEERALAANAVAARALQQAGTAIGVPRGGGARSGRSSILADLGNAAASLGNAALRNPLDGLAVAGGGALAAVGTVGAVGSVALDLTGVGAAVGLPLGAASAAAIAGGVGIAGAGLIDLAQHAATDGRITPFQANADNSRPDADRVHERVRTVGTPGRSRGVRVVPSDAEVREIFEELSEGGVDVTPDGYGGRLVELPDGTRIGLREVARSAPGATVETTYPDGRRRGKVHVDG